MKVLAISKDGKETLWILISFEEFKSHPTTDLTRYRSFWGTRRYPREI